MNNITYKQDVIGRPGRRVIDLRPTMARNVAAGESFPWDKCSLGYEINPAGDDPGLIRIYAGEIDRVAVAQADVTVTDNDYVYARRTNANDTMLVAAASSVPANNATYTYYRLYRFTVTDGAASVLNIYRPFDIEHRELPSNANKSQWMVLTMATANATANNDPSKWSVDWVRWI